MEGATSNPREVPEHDCREQPAPGVLQELVERRTVRASPRDADVLIGLNYLPAAGRDEGSDFPPLGLGVLVGSGDAQVEGDLHGRAPGFPPAAERHLERVPKGLGAFSERKVVPSIMRWFPCPDPPRGFPWGAPVRRPRRSGRRQAPSAPAELA